MARSSRSRAEQQFAATQKKKDNQVLKEREKAEQQRAEHRAYLRGLRLAKEAADKEATATAPAETPDTTPQAHRRNS